MVVRTPLAEGYYFSQLEGAKDLLIGCMLRLPNVLLLALSLYSFCIFVNYFKYENEISNIKFKESNVMNLDFEFHRQSMAKCFIEKYNCISFTEFFETL